MQLLKQFKSPAGELVKANVDPRALLLSSLIDPQVGNSGVLADALAHSGMRSIPTDIPSLIHSGIVVESGTVTDNTATAIRLMDPSNTVNKFVLYGQTAGTDGVKKQMAVIHRARVEFAQTSETAAVNASLRANCGLRVTYGQGYTGTLKTRYEPINIDGAGASVARTWTTYEDPIVVFLSEDAIYLDFAAVDCAANVPVLVELDVDLFPWDKPSARPILPMVGGCARKPQFQVSGGKGGSFLASLGGPDIRELLSSVRQNIRQGSLFGRGR